MPKNFDIQDIRKLFDKFLNSYKKSQIVSFETIDAIDNLLMHFEVSNDAINDMNDILREEHQNDKIVKIFFR